MDFESRTLGELLSDSRIGPIAGDAIRNRDLKKEPLWEKTLIQLKEEGIFSCGIGSGFERLYRAADTDEWYYPLYSEAECVLEPSRRGVSLVRFPSDSSGAREKPFILLVPGGGFVNVWNLTEGWPVAAQFNSLGYHVFILTYQVDGREKLLEKNMEDFARALTFIGEHRERFDLKNTSYITCGFSAGGYLVCLWNTKMGYARHALEKPEAVFPIYPVTSLREQMKYDRNDIQSALRLYCLPIEEAAKLDYEIPEHADGFPPCALFLAAGDELVDPIHSKLLAAALDRLGIPCRLEIGPEGGHGFADGTGMCMAGWTWRAADWYESL